MSAHGMSEAGGLREAVEVLAEHAWHTSRWSGGGWTWRCSCGAPGQGDEHENPARFFRHKTSGDASRAAVEHVARALLAAHPAPEADPTAGEHTVACHEAAWDEGWRCICPATPDAGDASEPWMKDDPATQAALLRAYDDLTGDASTSASEPLSDHRPVVGATYLPGRGPRGGITGCSCLSARDYLAAGHKAGIDGWMEHLTAVVAAREAKARAEAGEQIAQAIEALSGNYPRKSRVAAIAREVTRPATAGPVDWDSPTWGGGRHEAAWAPDGTHDDVTEEE